MTSKTTAKHVAVTHNLNRPWRTTDIINGNLILNWHGQEIARVCSTRMTPEAAKETRAFIVQAVNTHDAAMRVVNLAALMLHTCKKRKGGQTVTVHACLRCLAEVAQARAEVR